MGTPYFNSVVARTGFEPVISALRGRRLKPAGLTRHLGVPICLVPVPIKIGTEDPRPGFAVDGKRATS